MCICLAWTYGLCWCMCCILVWVLTFCSSWCWCRRTNISLCRAGIVSHTSTSPHMATHSRTAHTYSHAAHMNLNTEWPLCLWRATACFYLVDITNARYRHPCKLCNANRMSERHGGLDKLLQTVSTALPGLLHGQSRLCRNNSVAVEAAEWKIRPPSVRAALHMEGW